MRFLLVHSPLVGRATWRGVADALAVLGHAVDVPDLRDAAAAGDPHDYVGAARAALHADTEVVVGHSGAGFFLPSIAADADPSVQLLFVDAGPPPAEGAATASADFLDRLRSLAVDGVLPRWSQWWDGDVMARLVPDELRRAHVESELPEVPLRFYETPVAIPAGWRARRCGVVLLSEGYRDEAIAARALGWPARELLGGHLHLVNDPESVAGSLTQLSRRGPTA